MLFPGAGFLSGAKPRLWVPALARAHQSLRIKAITYDWRGTRCRRSMSAHSLVGTPKGSVGLGGNHLQAKRTEFSESLFQGPAIQVNV